MPSHRPGHASDWLVLGGATGLQGSSFRNLLRQTPDFDQLVRFLPAVEPVEDGSDIGG
jgi:hypothetical protein